MQNPYVCLQDLLSAYKQDYEWLNKNRDGLCNFDTIPEVKQAKQCLAEQADSLTRYHAPGVPQ